MSCAARSARHRFNIVALNRSKSLGAGQLTPFASRVSVGPGSLPRHRAVLHKSSGAPSIAAAETVGPISGLEGALVQSAGKVNGE